MLKRLGQRLRERHDAQALPLFTSQPFADYETHAVRLKFHDGVTSIGLASVLPERYERAWLMHQHGIMVTGYDCCCVDMPVCLSINLPFTLPRMHVANASGNIVSLSPLQHDAGVGRCVLRDSGIQAQHPLVREYALADEFVASATGHVQDSVVCTVDQITRATTWDTGNDATAYLRLGTVVDEDSPEHVLLSTVAHPNAEPRINGGHVLEPVEIERAVLPYIVGTVCSARVCDVTLSIAAWDATRASEFERDARSVTINVELTTFLPGHGVASMDTPV
jgi:hypothetical protein